MGTPTTQWVGRPSGPPYPATCSPPCPRPEDAGGLVLAPDPAVRTVREIECITCGAASADEEGTLGRSSWALAHARTTGHDRYAEHTRRGLRTTPRETP
ncbi:DUF7848 domain-containing protein [Streptomyces sp. NPDC055078]